MRHGQRQGSDHHAPVQSREGVTAVSKFDLVHSSEMPGGVVQTSPGRLAPRQVLDIHADLHRYMTGMSPQMRGLFADYARRDLEGHPEWAASHIHPARDGDLNVWLDSLGHDLAGATTFQVTAEMCDLAEALAINNTELGDITREDLPAEWGFMWFDKPLPRVSDDDGDRDPLKMHAVSWAAAGNIPVTIQSDGKPITSMDEAGGYTANLPCVRIREWGWNDNDDVIPRPLHLIGQTTTVLTPNIGTSLASVRLVHMIWILMGMEIVTATRQPPENRAARKRAANLKHNDVHVITLRRPAQHAEPAGEHRHIDWTCTWLVRRHDRHLERQPDHHAVASKPGGPCEVCGTRTARVRPYIKGPEGLPLRAHDILYRLSR